MRVLRLNTRGSIAWRRERQQLARQPGRSLARVVDRFHALPVGLGQGLIQEEPGLPEDDRQQIVKVVARPPASCPITSIFWAWVSWDWRNSFCPALSRSKIDDMASSPRGLREPLPDGHEAATLDHTPGTAEPRAGRRARPHEAPSAGPLVEAASSAASRFSNSLK